MVFFLSGCKGSNTNTRAAAYSRTKKVTKTKTNRKAKVEALMKQCYELAAKGEINKARDIARDLPYRDQFQARENIIKGIHKRARYLAFHGKKNEAKIILEVSILYKLINSNKYLESKESPFKSKIILTLI